MAAVYERLFKQPAMGLKLLPHKIKVNGRTISAAQVEMSLYTQDVLPHDILVAVNGISLLGKVAMQENESAQAMFDATIDTLLDQPAPRRVRFFRTNRATPEADGTTVQVLNPDEAWVLLREAQAAQLGTSSGGARAPAPAVAAGYGGPTPPQRLSLQKPQPYGSPSPAPSPREPAASPRTVAGQASSDTSSTRSQPMYSSYRNEAPAQKSSWPPSPFKVIWAPPPPPARVHLHVSPHH